MKTRLLKFYSKTCGPCKLLENNLQHLQVEHENIDINTNKGMNLAAEYGVRNVPTLVLLDYQDKMIKKQSGLMNTKQIEEFIS